MDAAIAGLIGAAIGASSTLTTVWIQARYQAKREKAKFIMEFAASDRQSAVDMAVKFGRSGPLAPVALFVHYHQQMFELLERGKITEPELRRIADENETVWKAIQEIDQARRDSDHSSSAS